MGSVVKTAICQVADTGPLESLVDMLEAAGYTCYTPNTEIRSRLRSIGCDTVLDIDSLVAGMGYEKPRILGVAHFNQMYSADLYVEIKAQRNAERVWEEWPNLRDKTLWYRINGAEPEHVIKNGEDYGDEVNPPCPILTPNQWYKEEGPWSDKAYVCWPPFHRIHEYRTERNPTDSPLCLIHNLVGWGYGALVESVHRLGVRMYGDRSPDGLINHRHVPKMLSTAKAMVHMKSSDAPGYALYEALAARCPLIVPRRLIWRSHMEELFIPEETCLVYDRPTHDALSADDVETCTQEISEALERLECVSENKRIGEAGYSRLKELMWNTERDGSSFRSFMEKHYGG